MFCKKSKIIFNSVKEFDTDGRSNETFRSETSHGYRPLLPTMEHIYRVRWFTRTTTTARCSTNIQLENDAKNSSQLKELAEQLAQTYAKAFLYPWPSTYIWISPVSFILDYTTSSNILYSPIWSLLGKSLYNWKVRGTENPSHTFVQISWRVLWVEKSSWRHF